MKQPVLHFDITPPQPLTPAATLVPVMPHDGTLQILLTIRTEKVQHHKGQICFPGGMREGTESLWDTAVRETEEEIGLSRNNIMFIDELPQILTPTSFAITPYVGLVHNPSELIPNRDEIEDVFSVPVEHLLDPNNLRFEDREYFGQKYPVPFFTYEKHVIWGATGRMILDFLERYKGERWRQAVWQKLKIT